VIDGVAVSWRERHRQLIARHLGAVFFTPAVFPFLEIHNQGGWRLFSLRHACVDERATRDFGELRFHFLLLFGEKKEIKILEPFLGAGVPV